MTTPEFSAMLDALAAARSRRAYSIDPRPWEEFTAATAGL